MNVALLIVDMQNGCRKQTQCKLEFDQAVQYINEISGYFRQKDYPVFIIKDIKVGGPETSEFEYVDDLITKDTDIVIYKEQCNAFWETNLDCILKEREIDCVIISGFAAEYCIVFTYNGAVERGYNTFLLQNGIAGFDADEIKKIQLLRPVISYKAIEYFL